MKKIVSMILTVMLTISTSTSVYAAEPISAKNSEKVEIVFVSDTQYRHIENFIVENNIVMDSFKITVDDKYTSGYVIKEQDDFENLWNDFVAMQAALFNERNSVNSISKRGSDMQIVLDALESNDFQMTIICNDPTSLARNSLVGADIVESIQPIGSRTVVVETENAVSTTSANASNWVPTSGSAGVWPSQNVADATYLEVRYMWASAEDLSTLTNDSDSTLEGDLVLYNYNGEARATGWYTGNYTYNTNQPRAYQDTQAFDNADEPVFSIGCSDASALEAGIEYYWAAYGNSTDATGGKAKLNFQRGNRLIDDVYEETWNIFGEETVTVIPFSSWDATVDIIKYFTY